MRRVGRRVEYQTGEVVEIKVSEMVGLNSGRANRALRLIEPQVILHHTCQRGPVHKYLSRRKSFGLSHKK